MATAKTFIISNNTDYIGNLSENALLESAKHTEQTSKEQNQEVDQQTRTRVNTQTDLRYQPDMSGDERTILHLNGTKGQMESTITHGNTSATRNETYSPDQDHDDVHVTSGGRVGDPILLNQKQHLSQSSSYTLDDIANGQDHVPATGRRQNIFETMSDDQVDEDAAPTTMQRFQDKTCALVSGISDRTPCHSM